MLNKNKFIFITYNGIPYPCGYKSSIHEIAAHFDKSSIDVTTPYSLHTEYSYGKRSLQTELIHRYPILREANKDGVPQLWRSSDWATSFAQFIVCLTADASSPEIIEIHPPFNDYCSIESFIEYYSIFSEFLHSKYPNAKIVLENRAGSVYRGGKFLISKASEIAALCETIKTNHIPLGIVLDFPQLLTAENINPAKFNLHKYNKAIELIAEYRDVIKGIHIWGKKKSSTGRWVAHCGDLKTYFAGNEQVIADFIEGISTICNDNTKRFLVPEVNSGHDDLNSIMNDLFVF